MSTAPRDAGAVKRGGLEMRVLACWPVRLVPEAPPYLACFGRQVRRFLLVRRGPVPIRVPMRRPPMRAISQRQKVSTRRAPALWAPIASAKATGTSALVAARITLAELLRPTVQAHVPTQAPPPGAAITGERATS